MSKQAWWKGKYKKKLALEEVVWDFELSDVSVTDMLYKLHSIMSPLVNMFMYIPLSQEIPLNRSEKPLFQSKRQRSIAWQNYKVWVKEIEEVQW